MKTSTVKRKKDVHIPLDTKRIKVQAQRKFAQGVPVIPVQTPKDNQTPSTSQEPPTETVFQLDSNNKPYTEDFLTYLCFKGTKKGKCRPASVVTASLQPNIFIPYGVRKQASQLPALAPPPDEEDLASKRRALQALSAKYRLETRARLRAIAFRKSGDADRVQTRSSKVLKVTKAIKKKRPNGLTENYKLVDRRVENKILENSKIIPETTELTLKKSPTNEDIEKKQIQPKKNERSEKGILKTASVREPMKTRSSRPSKIINKSTKNTSVDSKSKTLIRKHYRTRNNTQIKYITKTSDGTTLCKTRSGAIRRLKVPAKKKNPINVKKNEIIDKNIKENEDVNKNTKETTLKTLEFSSDDDEPLYKTLEVKSSASTSKDLNTSKTDVTEKVHFTRHSKVHDSSEKSPDKSQIKIKPTPEKMKVPKKIPTEKENIKSDENYNKKSKTSPENAKVKKVTTSDKKINKKNNTPIKKIPSENLLEKSKLNNALKSKNDDKHKPANEPLSPNVGRTTRHKVYSPPLNSKVINEKFSTKNNEEKPSTKIIEERSLTKVSDEKPIAKIVDEKSPSKINNDKPPTKILSAKNKNEKTLKNNDEIIEKVGKRVFDKSGNENPDKAVQGISKQIIELPEVFVKVELKNNNKKPEKTVIQKMEKNDCQKMEVEDIENEKMKQEESKEFYIKKNTTTQIKKVSKKRISESPKADSAKPKTEKKPVEKQNSEIETNTIKTRSGSKHTQHAENLQCITRSHKNSNGSGDTIIKSSFQKQHEKSFTDSDEEPLASKISDTLNKSTSAKTPIKTRAKKYTKKIQTKKATPISNKPELSILIDNETREIADNFGKSLLKENHHDSSLVFGIGSDDSSTSSDDESNITSDQVERLPRFTSQKREGSPSLNGNLESNAELLDELLNSNQFYCKDGGRNRKFMKSKEYIESWLIDSARLATDSPLAELFTPINSSFKISESETPVEPATSDFPSTAEVEKVNVETQCGVELEPTILQEETEERSKVDNSRLEVIPPDSEMTIAEIFDELCSQPDLLTAAQSTINEQPELKTIVSQSQPADNSLNIYEFESDSDTSLQGFNMNDDISWKPKSLRDLQKPRKLIPLYMAKKRGTLNSGIEDSTSFPDKSSCSFSKKTEVESSKPVSPQPQISKEISAVPLASVPESVTTFTEETKTTQTQPINTNPSMCPSTSQTTEGHHLFYIQLDGVTKSGASMDHMIEGVAVKMGTEDGDDRVIMRAKLVNKSEVDVNKSTTDNLANQTEPVREMVRSVLGGLPEGSFKNTFKPVDINPPGLSSPPSVAEFLLASKQNTPKPEEIPKANVSQRSVNTSRRNTVRKNANVTESVSYTNNTAFPQVEDPAQMVEAPVFMPTDKEFQDPLEYIENITPVASRFGLCRIIPPASFQAECNISEDMRFTPHNQYVHRMLHRWGASSKQMCAIKKYLATQGVSFNQPPKLSGIEVDLPKLYHVVQNMGGLKRVLEKKMWLKVAEEMCIPFQAHYMDIRLDEIYCKYLLPYDTLSNEERQKLFESVEREWHVRHARMVARAADPMREEEETDATAAPSVTEDAEECVTRGKSTTLGSFARLARNIMTMQFGKVTQPSPDEVEAKFWDYVTSRNNHICVNSGSIDSSVWGYGFPSVKAKGSPISKHPWNLKVLTNNSGSVLRSLGPMIGVTVPTLHVGMLFSACCWYRDPHGLPWIEFLHQGAPKVWYGVPNSHGHRFRSALASIVPGLCQQKTVWLLSDTAMVPPRLLTAAGVSLCRTVQKPGEFVLVFPKAFTSSLCTGYAVSESVYFALHTWLQTAHQDFTDIRNSCEPSMFSLERMMVAISEDPRSSYQVLKQVLPALNKIIQQEKQHRETLFNLGLKTSERAQLNLTGKKKVAKWQDEAEECQRCRTNLSLSMLFNNEDSSAYCLVHGAEFLQANPGQVDNCKLIYMHSVDELQRLMSKLIQRINTLANKKMGKNKNPNQ